MTRYRVRVELIEVVSDQSGITENIIDAVEATYDSREVAERAFALAEGRK
jgi:hypothetical protein